MKTKIINICKKHKNVLWGISITLVLSFLLYLFTNIPISFLMECFGLMTLVIIGLYGMYLGPKKTEIHNTAEGMKLTEVRQWWPTIAINGTFIVLLITAVFNPLGSVAMSLYGIGIGLVMERALIRQSTENLTFKGF